MANPIDRIRDYINEPYTERRVIEAARRLGIPFVLRELVNESGLPTHIVHTRLSRLVDKGVFTRRKIKMAYNAFAGRNPGRVIPGGRNRNVYLYSFVEEAAE